MNVLSLFDGMSCGRIALDRAGCEVTNYFASEIDKNAIKVSKDNWADIIHIGNVEDVSYVGGVLTTENGTYNVGTIDLVIGGSPCQDFSSARAFGTSGRIPEGLEGKKSGLFYHYLRILNEIKVTNPGVKFLLENVRMKLESKRELDEHLGVNGVYINPELVSFQKRARYYWTNILFDTPIDKNVSFQNHKCSGDLSKYKLNKTPSRDRMWSGGMGGGDSKSCANVTHSDKVYCITTKQDRCPNSGLVEYGDFCRYLTQTELEKAQTLPVGYTKALSYGQACAVIGNGWTVDVIAHILKGIIKEDV